MNILGEEPHNLNHISKRSFRRFDSVRVLMFCLLLFGLASCFAQADNWPQPAGPHGNWTAAGRSPALHWSVALNHNILWRTTLPEEGQSGIAVWGNRVFLTIMKPLASETAPKEGTDIVGYCLDGRN